MSQNNRGLYPVLPSAGREQPVPIDAVSLDSGFWFTRQELNSKKLLSHCDEWIENMGWYDAFRVAAGEAGSRKMQGKLFTDADVYKLLEALAWETAVRPDEWKTARLDEVSKLIAAAQESDGYVNTFHGPLGIEHRYEDLAHGHELYCAGHLFQAAVARLRAGETDDLTAAAIRFADRICEDFGDPVSESNRCR